VSDHIPDVTKMISDTPRTDKILFTVDVCDGEDVVNLWFARNLERELNAANERIKRLEEALAWYEYTVSDCNRHGPQGDAARHALAQDRGSKAKEVKL